MNFGAWFGVTLFQILCILGRYLLFFLYSAALSFLLVESFHQFIVPHKVGHLFTKYTVFGWGKFWSRRNDNRAIKEALKWLLSIKFFKIFFKVSFVLQSICNWPLFYPRIPSSTDVILRGSIRDVRESQPVIHVRLCIDSLFDWLNNCLMSRWIVPHTDRAVRAVGLLWAFARCLWPLSGEG